jgi:hypothetical protein
MYRQGYVNEWVEYWWNDADKDNIKLTRRKTSTSATLSTTNPNVEKVQDIFPSYTKYKD